MICVCAACCICCVLLGNYNLWDMDDDMHCVYVRSLRCVFVCCECIWHLFYMIFSTFFSRCVRRLVDINQNIGLKIAWIVHLKSTWSFLLALYAHIETVLEVMSNVETTERDHITQIAMRWKEGAGGSGRGGGGREKSQLRVPRSTE